MSPPIAKKKCTVKPALAAVQTAGPGMMFSRRSFFLPKRGDDGGKVPVPVVKEVQPSPFFQRFEPARRYIYDRTSGEAYAEWVGDSAVCLTTGQELFRSRRSQGDDSFDLGGKAHGAAFEQMPFDYSVPKQRHPNDYSISTEDILASGFITLDAFKEPDGAAVRLKDYEAFLKAKADRVSE